VHYCKQYLTILLAIPCYNFLLNYCLFYCSILFNIVQYCLILLLEYNTKQYQLQYICFYCSVLYCILFSIDQYFENLYTSSARTNSSYDFHNSSYLSTLHALWLVCAVRLQPLQHCIQGRTLCFKYYKCHQDSCDSKLAQMGISGSAKMVPGPMLPGAPNPCKFFSGCDAARPTFLYRAPRAGFKEDQDAYKFTALMGVCRS